MSAPEAAVRESIHRVERAIVNSGFMRPNERNVINLAPAELPKQAASFDLPISLGILAASGQLHSEKFQDYAENYPDANPGMTQFIMPGYMESDLWDGKTENYKIATALHYRFGKNLEAKYGFRYSTGTSIYMGNNRAPLQNFYQMIMIC